MGECIVVIVMVHIICTCNWRDSYFYLYCYLVSNCCDICVISFNLKSIPVETYSSDTTCVLGVSCIYCYLYLSSHNNNNNCVGVSLPVEYLQVWLVHSLPSDSWRNMWTQHRSLKWIGLNTWIWRFWKKRLEEYDPLDKRETCFEKYTFLMVIHWLFIAFETQHNSRSLV